MIDLFKEHMAEWAVNAWLKRVMPAVVAALSAQIARHLRFSDTGRPIFSELSVQALTALAIIAADHAVDFWFFLKRKAREANQKGGNSQ